MSIDPAASRGVPPAVQPPVQQVPKVSARDKDGDNDNDGTEGKAAKAAEASGSAQALPADPNKGRNVNISV